LHKSGLLLRHLTRRLRPNVDSDVLSAMLVAVQDFVKDAFRDEKGDLAEIRFGENRILVVEGLWCILAGITKGETPTGLEEMMREALENIERGRRDILMQWDGTMDKLQDVEAVLRGLVEGDYKTQTFRR